MRKRQPKKTGRDSGHWRIMAKTYVEYFADPKHREIYRRLLDEVELQKEVVTEDSQKFFGDSIS